MRSLHAVAVVVALTGAAGTHPARAESFEAIYGRESSVDAMETIAAYTASARSGSCAAARRLSEIYDRGLLGTRRDYAETLKWSRAAEVLGCSPALTNASPIVRPQGRPQAEPIGSAQLLQAASALEADGKDGQAVKAYVSSARGLNCEAARRLGEIYDKGLLGQSSDYPESLKWYNAARVLGCEVPLPRTN